MILSVAIFPAMLFPGNLKILDAKTIEEHGSSDNMKYQFNIRRISLLNTCPVRYSFVYNYIDDPAYSKINPRAKLPRIGDTSASNTGIGLLPGWYENGFLGIEVNGKNIFGVIAKIDIDEALGRVEFSWTLQEGTVRAVFIIPENGDWICGRVDAGEIKDIKSLLLTFMALPGHHGAQKIRDRWGSTAEHNWQYATDGSKAATLDITRENWILLYDSQENLLGSAGILFDTEKLQAVYCILGETTCKVNMRAKPGCNQIDFMIWGFPHNYKSQEAAYDHLNENSANFLKILKNVNFKNSTER